MRGPIGGGFFGGSTRPPLVPISDAFWASGGWWDLSTIAGVDGAPYVTATPPTSATGLGVFTPGFFTGPATPVIYNGAIGGKRGLVVSQAQNNYLENDALAAIINGTNKTWTVVFDYQQNDVGVSLINNCVVGWGSAGGVGAQNHAKFYFMGTASGGSTPQSLSVFQSANVGFVATQNNLSQVVAYDYFRFAASYDGTTLTTYINGAPVAVVPSTWQAAVMAITKMMWGAWPVNGVGFEAANGYIRRLGVRAVPSTAPQIAQIDANMIANDYTLPQSNPRTPEVVFGGASIAQGINDGVTGMGWRYEFATYVQNNRRSWTTKGAAQGFYALRNTTATSGIDAPTIAAAVIAQLTSRTRIVEIDFGNQEINLGQTALQVETAITNGIQTVRTAMQATCPPAQLVLNTICPYSEAPMNAVVASVNAALPGIWAASNAANPTLPPIVTWDANTAIGGPAYVQANFVAGGNDHPNATGYRLLGAAMMAVLGPYVNAFSPT